MSAATPANRDGGSKHYFYDFGGDEPIKAEIGRFGQRVRKDVEPAQTAGEQQNLSQQAGGRSAQEGARAALENVACHKGNQGIHEEKSSSRPEQLSDAA